MCEVGTKTQKSLRNTCVNMNRGTELNRKPKKIPGSDKPVPEKTNRKSQRSWICQSLIIIIVVDIKKKVLRTSCDCSPIIKVTIVLD